MARRRGSGSRHTRTEALGGRVGDEKSGKRTNIDPVRRASTPAPLGPAGGQIRMKRGALLRVANTDGVAHRIHSDGDVPGFPHQPASMAAGATYDVTLGATGTDMFYCHDHGQGTGAVRLTVE